MFPLCSSGVPPLLLAIQAWTLQDALLAHALPEARAVVDDHPALQSLGLLQTCAEGLRSDQERCSAGGAGVAMCLKPHGDQRT